MKLLISNRQENHDLISDVAKENGTEAAALPKLLLDIIEQVDGKARDEKREDTQQDSIAHNLPKVCCQNFPT